MSISVYYLSISVAQGHSLLCVDKPYFNLTSVLLFRTTMTVLVGDIREVRYLYMYVMGKHVHVGVLIFKFQSKVSGGYRLS